MQVTATINAMRGTEYPSGTSTPPSRPSASALK